MRLGGSVKKIFGRPYNIINLIVIWSFLLCRIPAQAYPEHFPQACSPPSFFPSVSQKTNAEKELYNIPAGNDVRKSNEQKATFVYATSYI